MLRPLLSVRLTVWKPAKLSPKVAAPVCVPAPDGGQLPCVLAETPVRAGSPCGFNLCFPAEDSCPASPYMCIGHSHSLLGDMSVQLFCPDLTWVTCLLTLSYNIPLYVLDVFK